MSEYIPPITVEEIKPIIYAGVLICKDGTKHSLSLMDKLLLGNGDIDITVLDKIYNSDPSKPI
jgi:hypothetical protein